MLAIAISFFVMIIAVAISSGFRHELRNGIALLSGEVSLTNPNLNYTSESDPITDFERLKAVIGQTEGVESVAPVVYRAGIIKVGEEIGGALFKGIPGGGDSLGVSIPSSLAKMLSIEAGDEMPAYYVGERVKARKFRVDDIYDDIVGGTGDHIVIAGIEDMRRLNSWSEDMVSAIEVNLSAKYSSDAMMEEKADEIGSRVLLSTPELESAPVSLSAVRRYPQIFAWLELIDRNVIVILILMTIVAGFNMISGLLILLFKNVSTIGTLKSLGMTDFSIASVFLRVSSTLIFKGMLIGNSVALLFCVLQDTTHLIKLNPENYFISFVPVHLNLWAVLAADLLSYLVIMTLLLIPSLFVSRVDPSKTVRAK